MALSKEEQEFVRSIKRKIRKYNIPTTFNQSLKIMSGVNVYTRYNDDTEELVDTNIEVHLIMSSFSYFINMYARVDVPGLGTFPMNPYHFQSEMAKEITKYRKIVLDKTRQCLTKDNYVITDRGELSIKDVKVNDLIKTKIANKIIFTEVTGVVDQGKKSVCRITTNKDKILTLTPDHMVLTRNGFKETKLLNITDEIITTNSFERVLGVKYLKEKENVYDISTGTNDFFANDLVVHNCGMSTVFALYSLWKSHFFPAEAIDVVSIKQSKAQTFVKKINSTMSNLPDWMQNPILQKNQQKIVLDHGDGTSSEIVSESQSDNAGRGDSLSVLILDEAAHYQSDNMIRGIVASANPTLIKTGGQMVVISCVVKETYIYTNSGLQQVKDFIPKNVTPGFNEIPEFKIDGINHQQKTNTFYDSGVTPTKKIHLHTKTTNEISEIHPYYISDDTSVFPYFKQAKDIKAGDYSVASCREKTFGNKDEFDFEYDSESRASKTNIKNFNKIITEDMAYFFGLLVGDGYINFRSTSVNITSDDIEIQEWLLNNPHFLCKKENRKEDDIHFNLQGPYLTELLTELGFTKKLAKEKTFPARLLQMSRKNISAMLSGLFDADGHSRTRDGSIGYTSTSSELLLQVKLLLDMFGIQITDERWNVVQPTEKVKVSSYVGQITLSRYFSKIFYEKIGFKIKRKQEKYEIVKHIEHSSSQTYPGIKFWIRDNLINKYITNSISQGLGKGIRKGMASPARILRYESNSKTTRHNIKRILDYYDTVLNHTDEYKQLLDFYEKDWYFIKVEKVESGEAHTYDFTIPETKSFYANGLITRNTPNGSAGKGGWYYEQVVQAKAGEKGCKHLEIDWWEIPDDDRIPGPKKGYNALLKKAIKEDYFHKPEVKKRYKKFFDPIARTKYQDNEWLMAAYKDLGEAMYRQEILHDFIIAGDKVFNEDVLERVSKGIKEPMRKNKLGTEQVEGLWVWKDPIPGHRYILGSDIATGTGNDYSAIQIIDVGEYEQVAEFKGFMSTPNLSRLLKKLGKIYNEGFIVIESNSIGESVFNSLYYDENDNYTNIYKQKKSKNGVSRYTGWITDTKTRRLLVNDFIDWITVDELWNTLKIYSQRLWVEMTTWVWAGGNKAEHSAGMNDDSIIAFSLGIYNRNLAVKTKGSFIIANDGTIISIDDDDYGIEDDEKGFNVVTSEDEDKRNEYSDLFGCSEEEYKWLLD